MSSSKPVIRLPWFPPSAMRPKRRLAAGGVGGVHPKISNASILRAIANPNSDPKQVLSLFTAAARQLGFRFDLRTYASILPFLIRHRRILAAEIILRRFPNAGISPGPSLLIPLASSALAAGIPSDSAARLLLSACPSASAFTSLLGSIIRLGHLSLAHSLLLQAVPDKLGFPLKIRHFAGLIRKHCHQGAVDEAEELMARMRQNGVCADAETWNCLIAAVCRHRSVDEGIQTYLAMVDSGALPDVITFSTLISRMGMEGEVSGCNALFGRMLVVGIFCDLAFYRILIGVYCNNCLLSDALGILRAMKIDGFLGVGEFQGKSVLECGFGFEEVSLCFVLKRGIIGGFLRIWD